MEKQTEHSFEEPAKHIAENRKEDIGRNALERWLRLEHRGSMKDPDGHACLQGKCGESLEIFLKFEGERVRKASFLTDGCVTITACSSCVAEMALGRGPDEILDITPEAIIKTLGGLPEEEAHCASLAAETIQEALNDYMLKQTRGNRNRN